MILPEEITNGITVAIALILVFGAMFLISKYFDKKEREATREREIK